jgi:UDP-2,3-diacylglucosamine hydrolase
MPAYFISDLHLSPETPRLTEGFLNFLHALQAESDELYILGDFFDAWLGDDEDEPFYLELQQQLAQKTQLGLNIYFMAGNRDFLVGKGFSENTGVRILREPTQLTLGSKEMLLMHGDSLCTADKSYMIFRAIVRNAFVQRMARCLPLSSRKKLASKLRSKSKSMNAKKPMMIMDVVQTEVEAKLEKYGADILLHGHTHRPARHKIGDKERIVLGDWGDSGWCLKIKDDNIDLIEFALGEQFDAQRFLA